MSFIVVFIFCFITSVFFFTSGTLSNRFFFKIESQDNILEYSIIGIIFLSCIALIANFIISLNTYFNTILIIICLSQIFF